MQLVKRLSSGALIPTLGLGTWNLHPPALEPVIKTAVKADIRHFDCAAIYENEAQIGRIFSDIFAQQDEYKLKREDVFLTSKLWCTCHSREDVFKAVNRTLSDLNTDYLDLYLIHWPFSFESKSPDTLYSRLDENGVAVVKPVSLAETWGAMEELVAMGKVRAIGVSNFTVKHLRELLLIAKIRPAVNQVELHPYLPQPKLLSYCEAEGIVLTAYSPFGSGKDPHLLQDPALKSIASRLGITTAQLLISWAIGRKTCVIPRTSNPDRVRENSSAVELSQSVLDEIACSIKTRHRYCNPIDWWKMDCFDSPHGDE